MTTFAPAADARTARPATPRSARVGAEASTRSWGRDWLHAFRAASAAPRPEGMDPVALRVFGRD